MKAFLIVCAILTTSTLFSQEDLRKKHLNLGSGGIAISGYDPVAYFSENKAVKGEKQYAVFASGAIYYFNSKANKDLFLKNWKTYEPQYGGWCAYAMGAKGEKVEVNPETFKIINGKLYLFYNKRGNNTLTKWNKSEASLKAQADVSWGSIYH
jgi:YHS domain-containing protein